MEDIRQQEPLVSFITKDRVDLLSALIALSLKASTAFGGVILVLYAANEGFFYDVSSFAAVAVLLVVLLMFSLLTAIGLGYGALSSICVIQAIVWLVTRLTKRRPARRLRPSIATKTVTAYSAVLFSYIIVRLLYGRLTGKSIERGLLLFFFAGGFLINVLLLTKEAESSREISMGLRFVYLTIILLILLAATGSAAQLLI